MALSNAALAIRVNEMAIHWDTRELEMRNWISGTATGGPNADGAYPLSTSSGSVYYIKCPAALAAQVGVPAALVDTKAAEAAASATAAAASATSASASATTATTQRNLALDAKVAAELARNAALAAEANSSVSSGAAATSAAAAAASATAAADSAAANATFDPESYYTKTVGDARYRLVSTPLAPAWGNVTGTLSAQADLQGALNAKVNMPTAPDADRILFFDRTSDTTEWLSLGAGLSITGTVLSVATTAPTWGGIFGTLSNQTDLQDALNAKANAPAAPAADRILFYDLSAAGNAWLSLGSGLSITGTVLSASTTAPSWGGIGGVLANQSDLQDALNAKYTLPAAPAADRILFYDLSGAGTGWLSLGSGLSITGTVLSASSTAPTWGSIFGTLSDQTDLQDALNAKANLASPTFTGTVSGITKTMVGLGNVDNTSDANKPVSTAQAAALLGKVNMPASPGADSFLVLDAGPDVTVWQNAATARATLGLATVASSGSATDLTTGSIPAARIANGTITNAMQASMAANTLSGNNTGAAAAPADIAVAANQFVARGSTGDIAAKGITDAALAALLNMTAKTSWTPTVVGSTTAGAGTYTTQTGFYIRFGNIVFFKLWVAWTAHTGTGTCRIVLPIAAADDSCNTPVISGLVDNYGIAAAANIAFDILANTTHIRVLATPSGGGATAGQTLDTAASIQLAGFYFA